MQRSQMVGSFSRFLSRTARDIFRRPGSNFAALDGMRGFAILMVVFYHCAFFSGMIPPEGRASGRFHWLLSILNGMISSVDIFFVLSGFLVGRLLITNLIESKTIYYRRFLIRRVCHILPAYYLVLLIIVFVISRIQLPIYYYLFGSVDLRTLLPDIWTNFIYVNNYMRPGRGIFSWGWFLCVQEHFYLILPSILWFLFRYARPRGQLAGLWVCAILPCLGRMVQYLNDPNIRLIDGFYYYSHNRFDEIFFGVIIAFLYVCKRNILSRFAERAGHAMWIFGLACIGSICLFGGLQVNGAFSVVWQFSVMAMGSSLLLVNGLFSNNVASRFFSHPVWYPLARVSYGIYLIHPFVIFFFINAWLPATEGELLVTFLLVMSLSSVISAVLFVAIENPFVKIGNRWARKYGPHPTQLD